MGGKPVIRRSEESSTAVRVSRWNWSLSKLGAGISTEHIFADHPRLDCP